MPLAVGPAMSASGGSGGAGVAIITLVAPTWLDPQHIARATALVEGEAGPLMDGRAAQVVTAVPLRQARTVLEAALPSIDLLLREDDVPLPQLIIADMDSTMITVECIDELADYAGIKPQVAAITERAMRGELDFRAALEARVALLKAMPAETLDRCLAERVQLMPGARTMVRTLKGRGAKALLVSGGFTRFAEPVAKAIGFDDVIANRLEIERDHLSGKVEGAIVDASTKLAALERKVAGGVPRAATLAIGDGANDAPMLAAAGWSVAYRPHAVAADAAQCAIRHTDHRAILYACGIAEADWVTD